MICGPWCALNRSRMTRMVEPISSQITPTLLMRDISLTPSMLMIVVMMTRIPPSTSAFWAPALVR